MDKIKLMIVEDEWLVGEDLKQSLEDMGYEICALLTTGEAAVKTAETERPDLVLMDIKLFGDMDGIDAAEIISKRLEIPIIYLTAHSDDPLLDRAIKTKPYGYMIKPINLKQLNGNIKVALHKHAKEKQIERKLEALAKKEALAQKKSHDQTSNSDNH